MITNALSDISVGAMQFAVSELNPVAKTVAGAKITPPDRGLLLGDRYDAVHTTKTADFLYLTRVGGHRRSGSLYGLPGYADAIISHWGVPDPASWLSGAPRRKPV